MNTTCDEMEGVSRADVEGHCVWHRDALRGEGRERFVELNKLPDRDTFPGRLEGTRP